MKHQLTMASIAAIIAAPALADNTDRATLTITGEVIAALEITEATADITMPALVVDDSSATSVAVTCAAADGTATATYTGQGNPFTGGTDASIAGITTGLNTAALTTDNTSCATFNITGETGYAFEYLLSIPTATLGIASVSITDANCIFKGAGVAATTGGSQTATISGTAADNQLYCGATITAAAGASTGSYANAGAIVLTAIYD